MVGEGRRDPRRRACVVTTGGETKGWGGVGPFVKVSFRTRLCPESSSGAGLWGGTEGGRGTPEGRYGSKRDQCWSEKNKLDRRSRGKGRPSICGESAPGHKGEKGHIARKVSEPQERGATQRIVAEVTCVS